MNSGPLLIRPSTGDDLGDITAIYAHAVTHAPGTFETAAPSVDELSRRRDEVLAKGWPWLVAQRDGLVVGYAYANQFRPRQAYRYCVEDSIYLHPEFRGQGIARPLLAELLTRCERLGARQMLAVIGDSGNQASIALHRTLGFEHAGLLKSAGRKFDRWLDVVLMQRDLGFGDRVGAD